MIKLSRMADYGVILMVQLVRSPKMVTTATELTEATGLPGPTVGKLLKQLSRAGLLNSHRGANGGYAVSGPAEDISVADVVSALDGPIALTECMTADGVACEIEALCPTRTNWHQINLALVGALERVSLTDMAGPTFIPRQVSTGSVTADASVRGVA
ncbi:MAG: SUF system Fe-S cluster assembly regulator [Pseudomonadota bacterium]|nr:SUF system Fe-S cluster assembly regulator [Pseudomonadota bacterium]